MYASPLRTFLIGEMAVIHIRSTSKSLQRITEHLLTSIARGGLQLARRDNVSIEYQYASTRGWNHMLWHDIDKTDLAGDWELRMKWTYDVAPKARIDRSQASVRRTINSLWYQLRELVRDWHYWLSMCRVRSCSSVIVNQLKISSRASFPIWSKWGSKDEPMGPWVHFWPLSWEPRFRQSPNQAREWRVQKCRNQCPTWHARPRTIRFP